MALPPASCVAAASLPQPAACPRHPRQRPPQGARVLKPIHLAGGLFNQLWSLFGVLFKAVTLNISLVLPYFESHLNPHSMGVVTTHNNSPYYLTFSQLFDFDCFAAA